MKEFKHTPGPWQVSAGAVDNPRLIVENDLGLPACAMSLRGVQGDINKMEANARLIAAAPDLLESGQKALKLLESVAPHHPQTAELRTAITKATGEES